MNNHSDSDNDIIDFDNCDEEDNKPKKGAIKQNFNFQEESEREQHEPGMSNLNQEQNLQMKLDRPKTSAYNYQQQQQIQRPANTQQQQIQKQQQQSDDSVSDTDNKSAVNQSIINFQSELGEQVDPQEVPDQQVQPNTQQLQQINDNDNQSNQQQEQPQQQQQMHEDQPPQSSVLRNVSPFPPKLEIEQLQELLNKDRKQFLTTPLIQNRTLQCCIKRDKSGLARLYPVYHVFSTDGNQYLFSAKKVVMNTTSNYVISMAKNEFSTRKNSFLGKVRSNFLGTEFILYDDGLNPKKCKDTSRFRTQLGIVYYESHIMQNKGPRKMKVLLPKVGDLNIAKVFQPFHKNEGMQYDYNNNKTEYIEELVNKPPRWDNKMKAHVLNFYGRVEQPSVKNFQLINPDQPNYIYLQFGRIDDLTFNLDFCWPITPLQALQICVTSFDFKFACE